ncbi:Protein mesA [Smittium mucronatum]|uniref:Protein mesA n=1 Tax=Smittium mucronatum TaxID=133383 RepID=A0A1R0GXT3_9FUNG|nr:Protein mesA [Smittium mucronatum]
MSLNVDYILVSEFDIDQGSILKHEYPRPTGQDPSILADFMLPDGAHARENDWTIFMINKSFSMNTTKKASALNKSYNRLPKNPSIYSTTSIPLSSDVFYNSYDQVRTKHDSGAKRGAIVKAMAVCTKLPYFHIFKPILLLALENYYRDPTTQSLKTLYNSLNSMDLSPLPRLNIFQKTILRHSNDSSVYKSILSLSLNNSSKLITSGTRPRSHDKNSESKVIVTKSTPKYPTGFSLNEKNSSEKLPISGNDYRFFYTKITYQDVNLTVRIPLTLYSEEIGDTSLAKLLTKFGGPMNNITRAGHPHLDIGNGMVHPVSILINSVLTQKRIVFLGHNLPADEVADYVLAAVVIGTGGGNVLYGLKHRIFPYTSLTSLDELLKVPGFIAGVTNPAFEDHHNWWDVLFNIKTGKVTISTNLISQKDNLNSSTSDDSARYSVDNNGSGFSTKNSYKESKTDRNFSYDQEFISDIYHATNNHYNEVSIREKFENYFKNFIVLVAIYEQQVYKNSKLFFAPKTPLNSKLNSDIFENVLKPDQISYGYSDEIYVPNTSASYSQLENSGENQPCPGIDNSKLQKEIKMNIGRIEGFIGTILYNNLAKKIKASQTNYPITSIDVSMIINRLRNGTLISSFEAVSLFTLLNYCVSTDPQIEMLISYLPESSGGLTPLVDGLYHQNQNVRFQAVSLLMKIEKHPVGSKFIAAFNYFFKCTYSSCCNKFYPS